jgi:hypothetical protein
VEGEETSVAVTTAHDEQVETAIVVSSRRLTVSIGPMQQSRTDRAGHSISPRHSGSQ